MRDHPEPLHEEVTQLAMVDVTKIPLGHALARLRTGWKKPYPVIIAAIGNDAPNQISFGNYHGLHYRDLPAGASQPERGDQAIAGHGFRRTTIWNLTTNDYDRSVKTWVCHVEPVFTPNGRRTR